MGICQGKKKSTLEEQKIREAFDQIDTNKSGFIESNELANMINGLADEVGIARPTQEDIKEAMKAIDINQDGKVNFSEYKKFVSSFKDKKQ